MNVIVQIQPRTSHWSSLVCFIRQPSSLSLGETNLNVIVQVQPIPSTSYSPVSVFFNRKRSSLSLGKTNLNVIVQTVQPRTSVTAHLLSVSNVNRHLCHYAGKGMNVTGQTSTATLKRPFSRRFFKLGLDTARYTVAMEMADVRQPGKVLWTAAADDASPLLLQCLNSVEFYTFVFKSLSPAVSVSISILHIVRGFSWAGSLRSANNV